MNSDGHELVLYKSSIQVRFSLSTENDAWTPSRRKIQRCSTPLQASIKPWWWDSSLSVHRKYQTTIIIIIQRYNARGEICKIICTPCDYHYIRICLTCKSMFICPWFRGIFFLSKARHNIKLVPSTKDITHRRKLFIYIHSKKIHSTIFWYCYMFSQTHLSFMLSATIDLKILSYETTSS